MAEYPADFKVNIFSDEARIKFKIEYPNIYTAQLRSLNIETAADTARRSHNFVTYLGENRPQDWFALAKAHSVSLEKLSTLAPNFFGFPHLNGRNLLEAITAASYLIGAEHNSNTDITDSEINQLRLDIPTLYKPAFRHLSAADGLLPVYKSHISSEALKGIKTLIRSDLASLWLSYGNFHVDCSPEDADELRVEKAFVAGMRSNELFYGILTEGLFFNEEDAARSVSQYAQSMRFLSPDKWHQALALLNEAKEVIPDDSTIVDGIRFFESKIKLVH